MFLLTKNNQTVEGPLIDFYSQQKLIETNGCLKSNNRHRIHICNGK